jgi:L-ascorbate metabolism protein UlaG (beta-lactamase superfamily)
MRTVSLVVCGLVLWGILAVGGPVTVTYYGHSCFTLQADGAETVMLDPYGSYVPYPGLPAAADIVLMTHGHVDHCPVCHREMDRVLGENPFYFLALENDGSARDGRYNLADRIRVEVIPASHVNARGGGAGEVGILRFEYEGITFAHLGDLGTLLDADQMADLDDVEVAFLPVGTRFTLSPAEAMTVLAQLPSVKIVFPIHYYVGGITPVGWAGMTTLAEFTTLAETMNPVIEIDDDSVTFDAEDLPDTTEIWVLDYVE